MTDALPLVATLLVGLFIGIALGLKFGRTQQPSADLDFIKGQLAAAEKRNLEYEQEKLSDTKIAVQLEEMKSTVENLRKQSTAANQERATSETELKTTILEMQKATNAQFDETRKIAGALSSSQTRGKFGEAKLEALLHEAGLEKGIHYDAQESTTDADSTGIPDVTLRMPGETKIFIDSKFPFRRFFDAMDIADESDRTIAMQEHARDLTKHIDALAKREYHKSDSSPDFVVLFLPFESLLSEALRADSKILDHAFSKQVTLATPSTMLALLHSVSLVFRRTELAKNADDIKKVASTFLKNITSLHTKIVTLGKAVNTINKAYDDLIPTAEKTVIAPAKKISNLGISGNKEKLAIEYPESPGKVRELRMTDSADDFIDADVIEEEDE